MEALYGNGGDILGHLAHPLRLSFKAQNARPRLAQRRLNHLTRVTSLLGATSGLEPRVGQASGLTESPTMAPSMPLGRRGGGGHASVQKANGQAWVSGWG